MRLTPPVHAPLAWAWNGNVRRDSLSAKDKICATGIKMIQMIQKTMIGQHHAADTLDLKMVGPLMLIGTFAHFVEKVWQRSQNTKNQHRKADNDSRIPLR